MARVRPHRQEGERPQLVVAEGLGLARSLDRGHALLNAVGVAVVVPVEAEAEAEVPVQDLDLGLARVRVERVEAARSLSRA